MLWGIRIMEKKFIYEGPILFYGKVLQEHWKGETWAGTRKKAMNNLRYQVNKKLGKKEWNKITLPGKLEEQE